MAAFIAKLCAKGNCVTASRAFHLQFLPALQAKIGPFFIISLAFWAVHFEASQ
jgi:hypothetical protein